MLNLTRGLAWAWVIIIGALMITPGGVICIACGATMTTILGAISIVLGVTAFIADKNKVAR